MNIVYHQAEGRSLTWNVISKILENSNSEGYTLKGDISMHVAMFVSGLIGTFLLEQKNLEGENKESNL